MCPECQQRDQSVRRLCPRRQRARRHALFRVGHGADRFLRCSRRRMQRNRLERFPAPSSHAIETSLRFCSRSPGRLRMPSTTPPLTPNLARSRKWFGCPQRPHRWRRRLCWRTHSRYSRPGRHCHGEEVCSRTPAQCKIWRESRSRQCCYRAVPVPRRPGILDYARSTPAPYRISFLPNNSTAHSTSDRHRPLRPAIRRRREQISPPG